MIEQIINELNSNVNELTFISVRKLLTSYIIENMI